MMRIILFLGVLLVLALGLSWVADQEGSVAVTWLGQKIEIDNMATVLVALIAVAIALAFLWNLFRLAFRLPSLMTMAGKNRRKQKGYAAVSRGMMAVGAGDAKLALKQAGEAERLLGPDPLTLLLNAQSAQLSGDNGKAEKAFNAMLENAEMRVVGLRGLYIEAQRRDDAKAAHFYADEAYKLAPSASWASDAALAFRCQARDWLGAMALVEQAASRRLVSKETARKQRAVLLTADALDRRASEPDAALRSAQEAIKLDPSLTAAAAYLGRRSAEKGDFGKASKILEAAWSAMPHPDIAEAYLDVRIGDSALDRLKRAKTLLKLQPRDSESKLIVAKAALDAREFRTARETLESLVLEHPTVRACVLMAELEEQETGNMGMAREWLSRASRAERDKAWVADGRVSETWAPVSPVTGTLGGFVWARPPQAPGALLLEEINHRRTNPVSLVTAESPQAMIIPAKIAEPVISEAPSAPVDPIPEPASVPAAVTEASKPLTAPDDPGPDQTEPKKKWRLFG
jgi:HemY protein